MAALSEDLTSLTWTDREWLAHFPLIHTANASTVLEYFSRSPFYDRSCLNEQYKMQRLELTAFEKVPGVAYEVETEMTSEPSLFVISKNERSPELVTTTLAFYYILNGNVYQAPKAYAVLSTRIVQSMFHLKNAFSAIQEKVPSEGEDWYAWTPRFANHGDDMTNSLDDGEVAALERQTVDRLLYGVLERNRRVMKETTRVEETQ